jgi:plasmid stabilization system protein ParE
MNDSRKYEVLWAESAILDLQMIVEYIKIESENSAKKIFSELREKSNTLYYFPSKGKVVPELQSIGIVKYRELIHKRWKIIYKIQESKVYILIVVDSSRDLETILFQRLIKKD